MQEWILTETAASDIGDARLDQRFRIVLNAMSEAPSFKFPAACNGRAETAAAYRFVDNDKVGQDQVLSPHRTAALERIRAQKVVLIPQDTTELDMTRPHEIMAGAGPLNDESRVGFHDHVLLPMTPEGIPLGVVAADIWARDFDGFDKDADQKRAERRAKSIEEKESHRWLDGYREASRVAGEAPETLIVCLSDSEGDIYECLLEGQKKTDAPKAEWIIRACQDRGLIVDKDAAAGCPTRLRAQVASTPILGNLTVDVREREPKSKDDRKRKQARTARTAELTVQAARVRLRGPDRPGGKLANIEINCVLVTEPNPPEGAEPVEWLLLTGLPIDTIDQILTIINYYCRRWGIEIYFRILKSGCKVEESQLETAERFLPYLALCMIVAWRVYYVMMLGRECPDLPCDIAFDEDEWKTVYTVVKNQPPPKKPPSLKTMVGLVGSLGGHLGRKGDGEPGPKALWVGMQRMTDLVRGWRAFAQHGAAETEPASGIETKVGQPPG
jgi:Transposase Tn5 dimerisation domain/Transposase DNA-binding